MKNYIFDFGKVLVEFEPAYITGKHVKDREDAALIEKVLFDRLYWDALDAGSITDDQVKSAVCERLPERLHPAACAVYDGWVESLPLIPGMAELVEDIKAAGGKLYLLSNISRYFVKSYPGVSELNKLLSLFDGKIFSAEVGAVKPSEDIFRMVLERFGLQSGESIFIDDNAANIEGAARCGINTYCFDGDAYKLRAYLGF